MFLSVFFKVNLFLLFTILLGKLKKNSFLGSEKYVKRNKEITSSLILYSVIESSSNLDKLSYILFLFYFNVNIIQKNQ
jgi:hypothetical protein